VKAVEASSIRDGVGVGGVSRRAGRHRSPAGALNRLHRWWRRGASAASFPYRPVLGHFQAVGRNHADPGLVATLRAAREVLPAGRDDARALILRHWLPSTVDQEDGDYDTYAGLSLLNLLADSYGERGEVDAVLDAVQVVLLADLLRFETSALAEEPDLLRQQVRARACLRALARADELAPRARHLIPANPLGDSGIRELGRDELRERGNELSRAVLAVAPPAVRDAVEFAMLPTTWLHDEVMFIRSIQSFEVVYRQVARCVERAIAALDADRPTAASDELRDATRRITATTMLYRILTSMPPDVFAIIRAYTHGRSAVQSRSFRAVERYCAPPVPADSAVAGIELAGPSLQEVYEARPARGELASLTYLTDTMRDLDTAWRLMKRTHWGITLKVIGRVPGTGGTAGADYLGQAAARPLFPMLHPPEHDWRDRIA
jgi:tryptophan 2,3-dioxygenase